MKAGLYKVTYTVTASQEIEISDEEIEEMGEDAIEYAIEEDGLDPREYEVTSIVRYSFVG